MPFGDTMGEQKKHIIKQLDDLNIKYDIQENEKKIIVGDYWISYTNFYYGLNSQQKSIGRGCIDFLKIIKNIQLNIGE